MNPAAGGGFATAVSGSGRRPAVYARQAIGALAEVVHRHGREARVLDLGAGTGILTGALHRLGFRCTALEPDEPTLGQLRLALPGLPVVRARPEHLPFATAGVDVCTVAGDLGRFEVRAALAELARVLVAGGDLVLLWNARDEDEPPLAGAVSAWGGFGLPERWSFPHPAPVGSHHTRLHRWRVPG